MTEIVLSVYCLEKVNHQRRIIGLEPVKVVYPNVQFVFFRPRNFYCQTTASVIKMQLKEFGAIGLIEMILVNIDNKRNSPFFYGTPVHLKSFKEPQNTLLVRRVK